MILGMSIATFTLLHVIISLLGIASGVIVVLSMLVSRRVPRWTALFLATTVGLRALKKFAMPARSPAFG